MLRVIKSLLFAMTTVVVALLFLETIKAYDNNTIPNTTSAISVESWDGKRSKNSVFELLKKKATEKDLVLIKARLNTINEHQNKIVYDFNPKNKRQYSIKKGMNVGLLNQRSLQLEDVNGMYYTDAKGKQLKTLATAFSDAGLPAHIYSPSLINASVADMVSANFLLVAIGIISMMFIIMLLEKIYRFKSYAIMEVNGMTKSRIIKHDWWAGLPVFVSSEAAAVIIIFAVGASSLTFLGLKLFALYILILLLILVSGFFVLDVLSYATLWLIDIYTSIKGSRQSRSFMIFGYMIKISLVILVSINGVSLYNNFLRYSQDSKTMNHWIARHSGYTVQFGQINETNDNQMNFISRKSHQMIDDDSNVIISRNFQEFHPNVRDDEPMSGNVMFVNGTYLKYNPILAYDGTQISYSAPQQGRLMVLIPSNRVDQTNNFLKKLNKLIVFQRRLPNSFDVPRVTEFTVVKTKNNQSLFNYTVGKAIEDSVSRNAIVVIIDKKVFSDNFYWATMTQGMVQFSELKPLKSDIKKLGLESNITGITNAKTRLSDFNTFMVRQIFILVAITSLSLLQLLFAVSFMSVTFLKDQRQRMAIRKVFGLSNQSILMRFMVLNGLLDALLIVGVLTVKSAINILPYGFFYLMFEILIILFTASRAESGLVDTLNHGN
ncbi:hypothetical protein FEZ34_08505 [Lacticaseibacillus casei]|uniref:hypothetical protein n=1 Tax=Lacticaseibacillus casei TaxID=1582 RepID=UPI0011096051|nr:hypothetical protein [Lacticaseibacillus casei]TLQ50630.1 hypothetical protein FEZ34_08505 [Lacticaseibacillus casei]